MASKGDAFVKKAEEHLKSWNFFKSSSEKNEKAVEYYEKAANAYKMESNFEKSGTCFEKAARLSAKSSSELKDMDMARFFEEGGKMFANANENEKAKELYLEAGEALNRGGKRAGGAFEQAALLATDISEKRELFQRAVKCHRESGSKVSATILLNKLALMEVEAMAFDKALELFEQLGRDALEDSVTRTGAFRILFRALLANLAQLGGHQQPNPVPYSRGEILTQLRQRFEAYQMLDIQFNKNCREHMLMTELLAALEGGDEEGYDAAVKSFRKVCVMEAPEQLMLREGKGGFSVETAVL